MQNSCICRRLRLTILFTVATLVTALLGAVAAQAQLVVNEIDYDQASTDAAEFVEIKNVSGSTVDLSAYSLEFVNGSGGGAAVYKGINLPAVNLAAGGYFVVCANATNTVNCDLDESPDTNLIQNGDPDAVAIRMGTTLIDSVSYEGNTGAPYTEGSGTGLVDNPGVNDSGISRFPDGVDTDMNNVDLSPRCITPGAANAASSSDCVVVIPELVINEIMQNPSAVSDGAGEWFEIFNPMGDAVDIEGWTISDNDFDSHLINNGGPLNVPAGGFLVLGNNTDSGTNGGVTVAYQYSGIALANSSDELVLTDGAANEIDRVEWDDGATFPDPTGASMALINPMLDNNAGANWCTSSTSFGAGDNGTPGAANDCPSDAASLVINEIDYDQSGTDAAEFIEIKNTGAETASLGGYALVLVNGSNGTTYKTINLPGVNLAAGDYFVVCGQAANTFGCDLDVTPDTNLVQNGAPDAVALMQGPVLIDTVSYEGDTAAPFTEGSGSGLFDSSSIDFSGISRFPDGADTDMNNVDLSPRCITPGSANSADTSACLDPRPPALKVNEIDYDQPGSDTAEFVEIHNAGNSPADLDGVSLVLVNGNGGAPYNTVALPAVSLPAGGYFVVCETIANVSGCDLEGFSSVQNGSPDAVALERAGVIVDTVSYEGDTAAPYTEGSGSGLTDSGSSGQDHRGIGRFPNGADTDMNNVDLVNACITPGFANTSLTTDCSPTGPVLEIYEIQGSGAASAYAGQGIATEDNIVTAVGPEGFFMQTPDGRDDADVDTSNGIYVFTGGAPGVTDGDQVDVAGQVVEFFGFTEFAAGAVVSTDSSGNTLPATTVFDGSVPSPDPTAPSCAIEFECYEGMLIEIVGGAVTGPNQRFSSDTIAEVHITAAPMRTFREPGIEFPGLPGLPEWDGNPEVFELDADKLGLPNTPIPAGSSFDATGALGFEFGGYELWPTSLSVIPASLPDGVRARGAAEMTVGALNLFRLFDDVDDAPIEVRDPGTNALLRTTDDTVVDSAEYNRRLAKFSAYIRDVLDAPDVLAVSEAESLAVLQDLADRIASDDGSVAYTPYLEEGNDIGGIDVGFLALDTVAVDAITQFGRFEILAFDGSLLNDRPPLLLEGRQVADGSDFPFAVMAIHGRSLSSIDSPTSGERVRQKRYEQAQSVAAKVQALQDADPDINLVVAGDFNAFEFTDGYVDVTGHMKGDVTPADNLVCDSNPCTDLVDPDLLNQVLMIDAGERYSFIFRGNAQVLDHALTSSELDELIRDYQYGRGNADAALDFINDPGTPLRSSDHDGLVLFLAKDSDGDGVTDDLDVCPGTVIPESVPWISLGNGRWALTDDDRDFDTGKSKLSFDIFATAGCSCEQIIVLAGLGVGHSKFGCSNGEMEAWVELVSDP